MKTFNDLNDADKKELLRYPAYVTLLAVNADGKLDDTGKKAAMKLSHIRTYFTTPPLKEFYLEADEVFEQEVERINQALPQDKHQREQVLKDKLAQLEHIALQLDLQYAETLIGSMASFKRHVSAAHGNVLEYIIFPISYTKLVR